MNGQKFVEWFFSFSEKVVAYVINVFFVILFALPLLLVDLTFKEDMIKTPLIFIPLVTLYLVALKCTIYAGYSVFIKDGYYYKPYLLKSLVDRFLLNYLFNLVCISLLYVGLNSVYIMTQEISKLFYLIFFMIILLLVPLILYTNMQFAIYEKTSIRDMINNSIVLTFMYGIISIIIAVAFSYLVYRFQFNPFLVVVVGIPAISAILVYVHTLIEKNQKNRRSKYEKAKNV